MRQDKQPAAQVDALNLCAEHRHLDQKFDELIKRAATGDWRDCDAIWDGFSSALERHMAYEESSVFPAYARTGTNAEEMVQKLRDEHAELRQRLANLGVAIQLHAARAEELKDLVDALRAHAEREGQDLYPWLDARGPRETPFGSDEAMV